MFKKGDNNMIYLVLCDNIAYEAFTDEQKAVDRVKHLNSILNIFQKMCGYRWAIRKMLVQ